MAWMPGNGFPQALPAICTIRGKVIAEARAEPGERELIQPLKSGLIGRHAIYFAFAAVQDGAKASFDRFTFD